MGCMHRDFGLTPPPMPGVRPGGRPTFLCGQESRQRNRPCKTGPAGCLACHAACMRHGVRQASHSTQVLCSVLSHCVGTQGRGELAPLRSAQTGAASQFLKCASRTPWVPALLSGFEGEHQNSQPQQPTAKPTGRLAPAVLHSPLKPAEERRTLRPCAQRTSSTDSAQLFERSVAKRVLRGASRSEHRRAARCEAKGRAVRGRLFACFWVAQKEGRPPGRIPGWASRGNPHQREGRTP
jgi:hypothetical protein